MDTAVGVDGFIYLADLDFGQVHQRAAAVYSAIGAKYLGGIGAQQDGVLQMCAQIRQAGPGPAGGAYTPATWPIYAHIRATWGTPEDLAQYFLAPAATTFDVFASESVFFNGSQSPPAAENWRPDYFGNQGVPPGTRWFNFYPRGRYVRFGYQVEAGTDPLTNFKLFTEFWLVNSDGR